MFDHISIGVADIERTRRFYDAALQPLGYRCLSPGDTSLGYGGDSAVFWALASESPVPADPNSGLHFCFKAPTRKSVADFHRAALAQGGRDNGAPGPRPSYGAACYAAFAYDPDGHNVEAVVGGVG